MNYYDIKKDLRTEIMEDMPPERQYSDDEIMQIIESRIQHKSQETYMSIVTRLTLKQELFNAIRRLDLLQELLDDPQITEIMVNGGGSIFYEKDGRLFPWDKRFESTEKLEDVIQQIVSRSNRQVNEASPIVDARLEDGSRVNVVLKPVAIDGPILTIRKFCAEAVTMDRLVRWGALTRECARFLEKLVIAGYNIFISGSTGSGKTTMLNALAGYIPSDQRVITIEDSAELQIKGISNLAALTSKIYSVYIKSVFWLFCSLYLTDSPQKAELPLCLFIAPFFLIAIFLHHLLFLTVYKSYLYFFL